MKSVKGKKHNLSSTDNKEGWSGKKWRKKTPHLNKSQKITCNISTNVIARKQWRSLVVGWVGVLAAIGTFLSVCLRNKSPHLASPKELSGDGTNYEAKLTGNPRMFIKPDSSAYKINDQGSGPLYWKQFQSSTHRSMAKSPVYIWSFINLPETWQVRSEKEKSDIQLQRRRGIFLTVQIFRRFNHDTCGEHHAHVKMIF